MPVVGNVVFGAVFAAAGFLLIVGAIRRWSWLVDPPVEMWPFYSQAFIKKIAGAEAVRRYTMFCGVLFIAAGVIIIASTLWQMFT